MYKDILFKDQSAFFGTAETICLVVGGVVNLLLLIFHVRHPKIKTTILLYSFINSADLLICLLMLPAIISLWSRSKPMMFSSKIFRESWLFLWEVAARSSVFLIGLQSVLRTKALLYPFSRRISRAKLCFTVSLYTIILYS